jgi:hypothetical protein
VRVLLFNTAAPVHLAASVHDSECRMVNTGRKKGGAVKIDFNVDEAVADLRERGWPVRLCKCIRTDKIPG